MNVTIEDLYLAYRQAKTALYFERRGVGLLDLARFEEQLAQNLEDLKARLSSGTGWFDDVDIGSVHVVPKQLDARNTDANDVVRVGPSPDDAQRDLHVQVRLTPSPVFAILEVLYLRAFGPALDSLIPSASIGYRLDLRDRTLDRYRRWIFEYWPSRYQEFRTVPIRAARETLAARDEVAILSADFAVW